MRAKKLWKAESSALLIATLGAAVHVATASAEEATGMYRESASALQEVTVTAQRREENIQQVPVAVSAFSAADLERNVSLNPSDLVKFVPNVIAYSNGGQGGQVNYFFRGVGTPDGIQTFDSPVVTYLDDVPLGRIVASNINFLDLSSVQILQGPQGTLFGRNTTGGAVLYTSRKPSDESFLSQDIEVGTDRYWKYRQVGNMRFNDTLFGSVSGYVLSQDGLLTSRVTGDKYNGQFGYGARGALRYAPGEALDWTVSVDYLRQEGTNLGVPGIAANGTVPAAYSAGATAFGSFRQINTWVDSCETGSSSNAFVWEAKNCQASVAINTGLTSNLRWTLSPELALNFITGLRQTRANFNVDFTGNDPAPGSFPLLDIANVSTFTQFSQEIKASGELLNARIKYVGGLFYFHERDRSQVEFWYNFTHDPALTFPVSNWVLDNTTTSAAAYAQLDTKLVGDLTLTTGLRFTHDDKDIKVNYTALSFFGGTNFNTSQIYGQPSLSSNKLTPKIGLQYQITPDVMTYASYTNGFKSGGWSGRASSAAGFNSFGDETVNSYELGARTEWLDHRIRANMTLFRANYRDLQINTAYTASDGTQIFVTGNAGNAYDQGIQFESAYVILPQLTARLNAGWQHSEYTYLSGPAIAASGFSVGGHMSQAPPRTLAAGLTYDAPVPAIRGAVSLSTDVSYIPAFDPHIVGNSAFTDDNLLVNAEVAYRPEGSKFEYAVECRNCTWHYFVASGPTNGGGTLGEMPFAGLRVRYKR